MPREAKAETSAKPRLYLKSGIAPRWRQEIQAGRRAIFFSPFVTGRGAERILLVAGSGDVELYTVFKAKNFASGASSLHCLKRIVEGGRKVYHLPELHAKMLLIPGQVVTIGSQNLTTGGQRNREASLLVIHPKVIGQAEAEALEWLKDRTPVTLEMIADLEKEVRRLKKLFKAAKDAAAEVDEQVRRRQRERDDTVRKQQEEAEKRRRRLQSLSDAVHKLRAASERVHTRVEIVKGWSRKSERFVYTPTLMVHGNYSLTRWRFDGEIVNLEDCNRYLCLIEDTGKLGWARVAASRITFVSQGVVHGGSLFFDKRTWSVTTTGIWSDLAHGDANLVVKMKCYSRGEARLNCWFSLDSLEIETVSWDMSLLDDWSPPDLAAAFARNQDGIRDKVTNLLVKTFKFTDGQKLTGGKANDFFGGVHSRYVVRLAKVGDQNILIASRGRG